MSNRPHKRQSRSHLVRPAPLISTISGMQSTDQPSLPSIEILKQEILSSRPTVAQATPPAISPLLRIAPPSDRASFQISKDAKVAIPRLKEALDAITDEKSQLRKRPRVSHACEPCRLRKTKCSGDRPVCQHCQDFKIICFYAGGKRYRAQKQIRSMTKKLAYYKKLLGDFGDRISDDDHQATGASLADSRTPRGILREIAHIFPDLNINMDENEADRGTDIADASSLASEVSGGASSVIALNRTEEDFTQENTRHTGFMEDDSELPWTQRLRREYLSEFPDLHGQSLDFQAMSEDAIPLVKKLTPVKHTTPLSADGQNFSINQQSCYFDDIAIPVLEAVDPYEMPTLETANHLFKAYMTRVHPTFPVIGKVTLSTQFRKFMLGYTQRPPNQWLTIVNMIFAIAAKYCEVAEAEWKGGERAHLVYFSRARILSTDDDNVFNHPDLQRIQVAALMSLYCLCTNQINRAWTLGGIGIRAAMALGMNLRNDGSTLAESLKEIRYRLWWSLYTLEHRLCSMTGRMSCISEDHYTTPLPIPLDEESFESKDGKDFLKEERQRCERNPARTFQCHDASRSLTQSRDRSRSSSNHESSNSHSSQQFELGWAKNVTPNSSLYFLHLLQLTRLTQNAIHRLYNPASGSGTWCRIQDIVMELESSLDIWYRGLPTAFDFKRRQRDGDFHEYRLSLGFSYYGSRITINRPCLCRTDRKIPNQSSNIVDFDRNAATMCIKSAQEMLSLIPDKPNAIWLNSVGPWWSILHWLVQATTVLILEISFCAQHMPEEAENIFEASKKAVRWIHQMGERSLSARRAWALYDSMLRDTAAKIGREVTDLPKNPPEICASLGSEGDSNVPISSHLVTEEQYHQSRVQPDLYSSAQSSNFLTYTNYGSLAHCDQNFPVEQSMIHQIQYPPVTLAEVELTGHAYDDYQERQHDEEGGHHSAVPSS